MCSYEMLKGVKRSVVKLIKYVEKGGLHDILFAGAHKLSVGGMIAFDFVTKKAKKTCEFPAFHYFYAHLDYVICLSTSQNHGNSLFVNQVKKLWSMYAQK